MIQENLYQNFTQIKIQEIDIIENVTHAILQLYSIITKIRDIQEPTVDSKTCSMLKELGPFTC